MMVGLLGRVPETVGLSKILLIYSLCAQIVASDQTVSFGSSVSSELTDVNLSGGNCLYFQAQVCGTEATIQLLENRVLDTPNVYKISLKHISVYSNVHTLIYDNTPFVSFLLDDPTTNLTSCSESQWYWMSWVNGNLLVGRGNVVGEKPFLAYFDQTPFAVSYLGFTGIQANFTVPDTFLSGTNPCQTSTQSYNGTDKDCSGSDVKFSTNLPMRNYIDTGIELSGKDHIIFQAKGCYSITVGLGRENFSGEATPVPPLGVMFSSSFPSLSQVNDEVLRNGSRVQISFTQYNYSENCNMYRWYWVDWKNGVIRGGIGQMIGENIVVDYYDETVGATDGLTNLGIASEPNYPAEWIFSGCYFPSASTTLESVATTKSMTELVTQVQTNAAGTESEMKMTTGNLNQNPTGESNEGSTMAQGELTGESNEGSTMAQGESTGESNEGSTMAQGESTGESNEGSTMAQGESTGELNEGSTMAQGESTGESNEGSTMAQGESTGESNEGSTMAQGESTGELNEGSTMAQGESTGESNEGSTMAQGESTGESNEGSTMAQGESTGESNEGSTMAQGESTEGSTLSQGGSTVSQAGSTVSQGGSTVSQGGSTVSQGGSTVSQGGSTVSQGGSTLSQGGSTVSQGGSTVSQGASGGSTSQGSGSGPTKSSSTSGGRLWRSVVAGVVTGGLLLFIILCAGCCSWTRPAAAASDRKLILIDSSDNLDSTQRTSRMEYKSIYYVTPQQ